MESIIGPDFFQWGCHMFKKEPQDGSVVPWHQDNQCERANHCPPPALLPLHPASSADLSRSFADRNECRVAHVPP